MSDYHTGRDCSARRKRIAMLGKILFSGRQGRAYAPAAPLLTIELVDSHTEIAHRVTDDAFAAGRRDGGRYWTLCDALVLPASLTAPARSHCPKCERAGAPTHRRGGARGA